VDGFNRSFEIRISKFDLSLFHEIPSQTDDNDRKSLLAIQNAVRNVRGSYVYLEIGSYLGGSIQTHLLDPRCRKIYSIDKRPEIQRDERWAEGDKYPGNYTQVMLDNLKRISGDLTKITCFDGDASNIDITSIEPKADICFIDGEHTNEKTISDFNFCKSAVNPNGLIVFHDASVIFKGIRTIIADLKRNGEKFKTYFLFGSIFVISFGDSIIEKDKDIVLIRSKMQATSLTRWLLWTLIPSVRTRLKIRNFINRLHIGRSEHK